MEDLVIAVDPGREKCGIAVVGKLQGIVHKEIIPTSELAVTVQNLLMKHNPDVVVLGDRTTSKEAKRQLMNIGSAAHGALIIRLVDEHKSTDAARRRYWQDNPPRGLWSLVPTTMQTPPVPVDDYVAVILAERYLSGNGLQ